MCGRYVQAMSLEDFEREFKTYHVSANLPEPSWNIKPTNDIAVLLEDHKRPGFKRAESARWSLTPFWSKTLETRSPLFNARIESVLDKPSFKNSAKSRRCLIPASGYYEWTGKKSSRVPHYIHLGDKPLLFAGLHSWWKDPQTTGDEAWHLTATMLTMESYGPMQEIHNRIPVFVTDELHDDWLSPAVEGDLDLFTTVRETSKTVGKRLQEHTVNPLSGNGSHLILQHQ